MSTASEAAQENCGTNDDYYDGFMDGSRWLLKRARELGFPLDGPEDHKEVSLADLEALFEEEEKK